jgi:predicted PurR-regulated permease PerM
LETETLQKQALQLALTLGRRALIFWFVCVVIGLLWLLMNLLKAVHLVATITAISTLLAYVIAPGVNYLTERRRVPRIAAISLVYALCGLTGMLALAYLLPALQVQFVAFSSHFVDYVGNLQHTVDDWLVYAKTHAPRFLQEPLAKIEPESVRLDLLAKELQNNPPSWLGSTFAGVFTGVKAAAGAATGAILIPLFTFYILMDSNKYKLGFIRLIPQRWKGDMLELLGEIDHVLGKYIRGQLLVCLTIGVSIAVLLTILGVPYAILIGVFAGLVDIVPYVGVAMGMVPAFLIALGHKGILFALFVIFMMEVVHWTEGHIIVPAIIGQSVGLPPLVVMVALGAGAELGGVMGMFLSMPLAAIIRVLLQFYVARLERHELAAQTPAKPRQDMSAQTSNGADAVEAAPAAE